MHEHTHYAADIYNPATDQSLESDIAALRARVAQLEALIATSSAEQPPPGEGLSAGALREALISAMDLGGAYGQNLSASKDVVIQAGEQFWSLAQVAVGFRAGRFVLVLKASTP